MLAVPSFSLQTAPALHVATDCAPTLKSQFEVATQVTWLASPPMPLHWEESLQVTLSASSELPLHFAACVQFKEHASAPHSVLQSIPAAHVQAESAHVQPVPVHVGALLSPPQAVTAIEKLSRAMIIKFTLFSSVIDQAYRRFAAASYKTCDDGDALSSHFGLHALVLLPVMPLHD